MQPPDLVNMFSVSFSFGLFFSRTSGSTPCFQRSTVASRCRTLKKILMQNDITNFEAQSFARATLQFEHREFRRLRSDDGVGLRRSLRRDVIDLAVRVQE